MQSVQVERGVRVLDSPGVVFDDDEQEASNILLRNVVKVEDISDPIAVGENEVFLHYWIELIDKIVATYIVEQILLKTEHSKLAEIYNLFQFTSTLEFLTMLAMTAGRLHKVKTYTVV
jgi:nuclear GTP-binding protein